MPRLSNGSYVLPLPPVLSGTTIESSWANDTMADMGQALTDSLSRTAQGNMSVPILLVDGDKNAPGMAFSSEANSGLYRFAAGDIRMGVLSQDYMRWTDSDGAQFTDDDGATWNDFATAASVAALASEYQEGTWTPVLEGYNVDTNNGGAYSRIGNMVTVFADLRWSSISTGVPTDEIVVAGLPYKIRFEGLGGGTARMFNSTFMAWQNIKLRGRGENGDVEVLTRTLQRFESSSQKVRLEIYIGANDVDVTVSVDGDQVAELIGAASPSTLAGTVVIPTLADILPNGNISFSLTYMTDDAIGPPA
jgi:hypothetical protein